MKKIRLTAVVLVLVLLTLLSGCSSKPAENSSKEKPTEAKTAQEDKTSSNNQELTYKFTGMANVTVNRNIIYKVDKNEKLRLDVYSALGGKDISKTPTVVLIHGISGEDNLKNSDVYKTWGRKIAASGFNAVTFNWRPSQSSKDVSDLIKYIREHAKELNINSENITIAAFSAGVDEGLRDAMSVNTGFIKNIIAYYGYIDSSILTLSPKVKLPSFFIAMAAYDEAFPPSSVDKFIEKAKAAGCNVVKMVHSKAGHGFDAFNADDEETKLIIDKTLKFIEDNSK